MSKATLHRWGAPYGGMKAEEAVRLKKLDDENRRLKEVVAALTPDNRMLKFVAEGKEPIELPQGRPCGSGPNRSLTS